jgi:hypothetical protein
LILAASWPATCPDVDPGSFTPGPGSASPLQSQDGGRVSRSPAARGKQPSPSFGTRDG